MHQRQGQEQNHDDGHETAMMMAWFVAVRSHFESTYCEPVKAYAIGNMVMLMSYGESPTPYDNYAEEKCALDIQGS